MIIKSYNKLLDLLQFVVNLTRPDIIYAINLLSWFKTNLGKQTIKYIFHYLKSTIKQEIIYRKKKRKRKKNSAFQNSYSNADQIDHQDDRKSTNVYNNEIQKANFISMDVRMQCRCLKVSTSQQQQQCEKLHGYNNQSHR